MGFTRKDTKNSLPAADNVCGENLENEKHRAVADLSAKAHEKKLQDGSRNSKTLIDIHDFIIEVTYPSFIATKFYLTLQNDQTGDIIKTTK